MVRLDISEFSFGFAFLYEQTRSYWGDLRIAPILPSLQQERDLGWDAMLPTKGIDYYYQFKMSDYLSRPNAKFIREGLYNHSYYRIPLHRAENNRQHHLLKELSKTNPCVYYVAPEFNRKEDDINQIFMSNQITDRSRIIPLTECEDLQDNEQHCITFFPGQSQGCLHSKETVFDKSYSGKDLEEFYSKHKEEWKPIDDKFASDLFDKTKCLVEKTIDERRISDKFAQNIQKYDSLTPNTKEILTITAQMLSSYFGVVLVLVGSRGLNSN